MPRILGLAWWHFPVEEPVQKIVLGFDGEVLDIAPDLIHRFLILLNQVPESGKRFPARRRVNDGGACLTGRWVHRKYRQQCLEERWKSPPDVVGRRKAIDQHSNSSMSSANSRSALECRSENVSAQHNLAEIDQI